MSDDKKFWRKEDGLLRINPKPKTDKPRKKLTSELLDAIAKVQGKKRKIFK